MDTLIAGSMTSKGIGLVGTTVVFCILEMVFYSMVKMPSEHLGSYRSFHETIYAATGKLTKSTLQAMVGFVTGNPSTPQHQSSKTSLREPDENIATEASLPLPYSVSPGQFALPKSCPSTSDSI
jgi:hypothetical protein